MYACTPACTPACVHARRSGGKVCGPGGTSSMLARAPGALRRLLGGLLGRLVRRAELNRQKRLEDDYQKKKSMEEYEVGLLLGVCVTGGKANTVQVMCWRCS
eukprot:352178-Chlamydomonas_euryale.AAC.15